MPLLLIKGFVGTGLSENIGNQHWNLGFVELETYLLGGALRDT